MPLCASKFFHFELLINVVLVTRGQKQADRFSAASILLVNHVVMANELVAISLFTHPADTEQHNHPITGVFVSTEWIKVQNTLYTPRSAVNSRLAQFKLVNIVEPDISLRSQSPKIYWENEYQSSSRRQNSSGMLLCVCWMWRSCFLTCLL